MLELRQQGSSRLSLWILVSTFLRDRAVIPHLRRHGGRMKYVRRVAFALMASGLLTAMTFFGALASQWFLVLPWQIDDLTYTWWIFPALGSALVLFGAFDRDLSR
jgi:hypothetical protein